MPPAKKKLRLANGSEAAVHDDEKDESNVEGNIDNGQKKAGEAQQAVQQRRSLFVRSLPPDTTTESLTQLFSESDPVKHATAVINPTTKQCRGYGFVTLADAEDAQRAKAEFNGHVLDGRKLRVEIAEPRDRHGEGEGAVNEAKVKRDQEKAETSQAPKLIVRNLPWTIKNDAQLAKLFQSYGKVKQAYIPKRSGGLLPGFGFVLMRGRKNAEKAMEGMNGKELEGRTLAVDWAVAKEVFSQQADGDEAAQVLGDAQQFDAENGATSVVTNGDADGLPSDVEEDDVGDTSDDDDDLESDKETSSQMGEDRSTTMFVRNLPFTCTDADLDEHFMQFGSVRYARVVVDRETERPKGTGFVCFYNKEDADSCLRDAPRRPATAASGKHSKDTKTSQMHSILQNDLSDASGRFTMEGRVLQVTRAVNKSEAGRLTQEGVDSRYKRDKDKRRLYLLSEGTISTQSKLWDKLSPSERTMREASAKQRKQLIESNPSLHLSLTRLSVRNIPRSIDSKDLKALAREAVVGFAQDVKAGEREKLSREELARGREEMTEAEKARKAAGKGVVKQATIVFEGTSGGKVSEKSGGGRSRGYGFIEYHTHRNALMGLRWLNGHAIGYKVSETKKHQPMEDPQDRKKRLIVEFAIENAQVVLRRSEKEHKARDRGRTGTQGPRHKEEQHVKDKISDRRKRKRSVDEHSQTSHNRPSTSQQKKPVDEKLARRNQIIGRKRAARRARANNKG